MRLASLVLVIATILITRPLAQQQVYDPGNGVSLPVVVKQVKPHYTQAAMNAGIEGTVEMESVVLADGTVGDVRVVRSLDSVHGLDEEAVNAMKLWEFKPGQRDGKPVAVRIHCMMNFTLK
jgi:protein TonB